MWLIPALLSIAAYTLADVFGKKAVDSGGKLTSLELVGSFQTILFVLSLVTLIFGLGESGSAPWQLAFEHPLIISNLMCHTLYWLIYLLSMRFVGLMPNEALSGTTGMLYFIALVVINISTGKFEAMGEMFHPLRLIPIIFVIVFTFLFPNIEIVENKLHRRPVKSAKQKRRTTVIGLLLLALALVLDSADSVITTLVCDEGNVGVIDYAMTNYFFSVVPCVILLIIISKNSGKIYIPFIGKNKNILLYSIMSVLSSVLYLLASSFDAVRTGIIFIVYPIVSVIGARVFLKEKYTRGQSLCIWIVTIASVLFCIADGLL